MLELVALVVGVDDLIGDELRVVLCERDWDNVPPWVLEAERVWAWVGLGDAFELFDWL